MLRTSSRRSSSASLRHASLACKRWRSILSDPRFLRRFRKHHWKLLGFFYQDCFLATGFTPMLDPPDRIPAVLPENIVDRYPRPPFFLGCRHYIALLLDHSCREAVLWDPITGGQRRLAFPQGVGNSSYESQGQSAADAVGNPTKAFACLYDSKSDIWGDIISTPSTYGIANVARPSIMVGSALYWLLSGANILEYNIERQTLVLIEKPAQYALVTSNNVNMNFQILRKEDNDLGLAVLSSRLPIIKLWGRGSNSDGVVSWSLQKTIQLDQYISRLPCEKKKALTIGYDEDTNVIFLSTISHDFMLQLESIQFRYIGRREFETPTTYYPYTNFYTAVKDVAGGDGGP